MVQVNLLNLLSVNNSNESTLSGSNITTSKNYLSTESGKQSFDEILNKISSNNHRLKKEVKFKNVNAVNNQAAKAEKNTETAVSDYKKIEKQNNSEKIKPSVTDEKDGTAKDMREKEKPSEEAVKKAAVILAQALGINLDEAVKMLKNLNLGDLNLNEIEDRNQLVNAIAEFAGLNQVQKDTLNALIKDAAEQFTFIAPETQQNIPYAAVGEGNTVQDLTNVDLTDTKASELDLNSKVNESIDGDAENLLTDIKQKIQEAVKDIPQDSEPKADKEGQNIKILQDDVESKITVVNNKTGNAENTGAEELQTVDTVVNDIDVLAEASDTAQTENESDKQQESLNGEANGAINVLINENTDYITNIGNQTFQNTIDQALNNIKASSATTEAVNVTAKDIIEQVVNGSKIILSDDKSEMVMNLKPDSLGKLMLKIVTEKGIVMAKFTVENSQVKEILESNMQLLKDSLEKQGYNVENINVSVGHDGNSENRQAWERHNAVSRNDRNKAVLGGISVNANYEKFTDNSLPDLYLLDGSTLNLVV